MNPLQRYISCDVFRKSARYTKWWCYDFFLFKTSVNFWGNSLSVWKSTDRMKHLVYNDPFKLLLELHLSDWTENSAVVLFSDAAYLQLLVLQAISSRKRNRWDLDQFHGLIIKPINLKVSTLSSSCFWDEITAICCRDCANRLFDRF